MTIRRAVLGLLALVLVPLVGSGLAALPALASQFGSTAAPVEHPASWEAVLGSASDLRGLAPRTSVPRTLLTREQLQARVVEQLSRDPPAERLALNAKLLTALGLLERGADLRGLLLQFRGGLVLGQYDPETKHLFVVTGASDLGPLERVTAAHEFTHALQDQHFDLLQLRSGNTTNADRSLAIAALLESDAIFIAERYASTVLTVVEREERRRQVRELYRDVNIGQIPLVVREQSYFPYVEGCGGRGAWWATRTMSGDGYGAAANRRSPRRITPPVPTPGALPGDWCMANVSLGNTETSSARPGGAPAGRARRARPQAADPALPGRRRGGPRRRGAGPAAATRCSRTWPPRWPCCCARGGTTRPRPRSGTSVYTQAAQRRFGDRLQPLDAASPAHRLWQTPDGALLLGASDADTLLIVAPTAALANRLALPPTDPSRPPLTCPGASSTACSLR